MAKPTKSNRREQELLGIIARLEAENAALKKRLQELEDKLTRLRKNSSNSSKPPSSDIVKPPKPGGPPGGSPRKPGGQFGHAKHERPPFPPEEIDHREDHRLSACPCCGGPLVESDQPPRVLDQIEIEARPYQVQRHRSPAFWCPRCRKHHHASFPDEVKKGGLAGPRLTALIGYMKGVCHAAFSTIRKYPRDVVGVTISRGELRKIVGKAADALEQPWLELFQRLPHEKVLNVDETGHKDNGDLLWTWCFKAQDYTCFKIADSQGSKVPLDVLGAEFSGNVRCDYFSAYRKYMKDFHVLLQFCLAHLIRDLKFLTTYPDKLTKAYGQRVLEAVRQMFALIHRREEMDEPAFQTALIQHREDILREATQNVPDRVHVLPIAKRFRENWAAYFRFITTPGVESTNNLAERAIRFEVIDRRITQGTRSEAGRKWCERIWTVIATCATQGRSAFDFILDAVQALFAGRPAPSLIHAP